MKIYRDIPLFLRKRGGHEFNSLADDLSEEGKYFYLFAEDAIIQGNDLLGKYHRLTIDTFLVVEYDIPKEIILKNIGYGDYTEGINPLYLIESYIERSDLGNKKTTTYAIPDEKN